MGLTLCDNRIEQAVWLASPNFNSRPDPDDVSLLVIHCISLPPEEFGGSFIHDFFQNRLDASAHPYFQTIAELKVSAHFLIERDGRLVQFVECDKRAWHAGESSFQGRQGCNDYSLGVELEGCDEQPYSAAQYQTLVALTRCLQVNYPAISQRRIVGHSDVAPGRKTDPGPAFDWGRYFQMLEGQEWS